MCLLLILFSVETSDIMNYGASVTILATDGVCGLQACSIKKNDTLLWNWFFVPLDANTANISLILGSCISEVFFAYSGWFWYCTMCIMSKSSWWLKKQGYFPSDISGGKWRGHSCLRGLYLYKK